MENKVEAIINGKREYLHGVEAKIYQRGGEKAVIARREYLTEGKYSDSRDYRNAYANRFSATNEKSTPTMSTYYKNELED